MRSVVLLFLTVIATSLLYAAEPKGGAEEEFKKFIYQKMDYDKIYFESIAKLKREGKSHPKMTPEQFEFESGRALFNLPVLNKYAAEKEAYERGTPLTLPPLKEGYRVYINLVAILNMFLTFEKKDFAAALKYGEHIVVQKKENMGLTTEQNTADYYVRLFREYYFLMAACHYYMKNDAKAVEWFAKIEADADLQKLKAQIQEEKKQVTDSKVFRLEELRVKPLAVMDILNADKAPENDWMTRGIAEVLTSELIQNTEVLIVERSQLEKVYGELKLALEGVTQPDNAMKIGAALNAQSMLVGSFQKAKEKLLFTFRLVDAQNGQALEAVSAELANDEDLFKHIRTLALDLFVKVGWVFPETATEIGASRAPKLTNIRDLMQARLVMATKSGEAKALYAKAIKEDPALAGLFNDLKNQFKDIAATVAVTPFVNVTGVRDDAWMITAVAETMANDLPKLNFTVVERTKLADLYMERMGQVISNDEAVEAGRSAGADFLLMGSIFRQKPHLKLQARFVEVRTGIVLFTADAENGDDDLNRALIDLTRTIAGSLNQKLSQETLDQLTAKKMSREDFEKYARQQLAKDSLTMTEAKKKKEEKQREVKMAELEKSSGGLPRWAFWTAVGCTALGLAVGVSQFVIADGISNDAYRYDAFIQATNDPIKKAEFQDKRDKDWDEVKLRTAFAWTGVGLTIASAGYLIFDSIWQAKVTKEEREKSIRVTPSVTVGQGGGVGVAVSGTF